MDTTVQPVLRGYLWDKESDLKTSDLLKEVQFIWNILCQDKKKWLINTCDCLIEVTVRAGLTVLFIEIKELFKQPDIGMTESKESKLLKYILMVNLSINFNLFKEWMIVV